METGSSEIDFKRPDDVGFDSSSAYEDMFMAKKGGSKKGEVCPVCGSNMSYKERVDSWYCPKCKSFY